MRRAALVLLPLVTLTSAAASGRVGPSGAVDDVVFKGRPSRVVAPRALANWCGAGAEAAANRPDTSLSSPNVIHVSYAVPSDGTDRFASFADGIKSDVDAIGAWWGGQD